MEHPGDNGENYYSPKPPVEQVQAQERQREFTVANLTLLEEVVTDFEECLADAQSTKGIVLGQGVSTDAQLMAKMSIEEFAKEKLGKYKALLESVKPTDKEVK